MDNNDSKIIMFDSNEAANFQTGLSGWVSRQGHYWGNDERAARYDGCTHTHCEDCREPVDRGRLICLPCHEIRQIKRGKYPLSSRKLLTFVSYGWLLLIFATLVSLIFFEAGHWNITKTIVQLIWYFSWFLIPITIITSIIFVLQQHNKQENGKPESQDGNVVINNGIMILRNCPISRFQQFRGIKKQIKKVSYLIKFQQRENRNTANTNNFHIPNYKGLSRFNKVGSYVYNTLSRFARRIIDKMKSLEFKGSFAMLFVPLGFSLVVAGLVVDFSAPIKYPLILAGVMGVIGGAIYVNHVYNQMGLKEKEQKDKEEQHYRELLTELKGMRKDLKKK